MSFTARGCDGHSYSINALTGIVLVDGLPPNQLPSSISEDLRYKKVFGRNNFEVVLKSGVFETMYPMHECVYRFHKTGDVLVIQESQRIESQFEPGDVGDIWADSPELVNMNDVDKWGPELTKKLKVAYSHWVSRERNMILLREFDFCERVPHFVLDKLCCRKVPDHAVASKDA